MERQIKFRGKTVDAGIWVSGCLINYIKSENTRIITFQHDEENAFKELNYEVIPETVGLISTATIDGIYGGGELYQGDICEVSVYKPRSANYQGSNDIWSIFKCVLEFNGTSFYFKNHQKSKGWKAWDKKSPYHVGGIKKLGNIYDNPELLSNGS